MPPPRLCEQDSKLFAKGVPLIDPDSLSIAPWNPSFQPIHKTKPAKRGAPHKIINSLKQREYDRTTDIANTDLSIISEWPVQAPCDLRDERPVPPTSIEVLEDHLDKLALKQQQEAAKLDQPVALDSSSCKKPQPTKRAFSDDQPVNSNASAASSSSSSSAGTSHVSKKSHTSAATSSSTASDASGDEDENGAAVADVQNTSFEQIKARAHQARRRVKISSTSVKMLTDFFNAHVYHPYPTKAQQERLMAKASLDEKQVVNWFTNSRKRFWHYDQSNPLKSYLSVGERVSADCRPSKQMTKAWMTAHRKQINAWKKEKEIESSDEDEQADSD